MKKKIIYLTITLCWLLACRKEPAGELNHSAAKVRDTLTLHQARQFYEQAGANGKLTLQNTGTKAFNLATLSVPWNQAVSFHNKTGNYWIAGLGGMPTYKNYKQGYRKIAFIRNSLGKVQARILEIVPDGLYFQRKGQVDTKDFTGRVFVYDQVYHLLGGKVLRGGKVVGAIRPRVASLNSGSPVRIDSAPVTIDCQWYDDNYVDADGNAVIYSEKICSVTTDDDPESNFDGGSVNFVGSGTGGGGTGAPPAPSNLPGENGPGINPKAFMECFGNVPDNGATMKVTVYVQEPFPGTSFNIGPNSVGHVAIGLTKTNGSNSVTQVVGFYPDATGISRIQAPSKVVNNGGDLDYNVSISYTVTATNFNNIINYVANPPKLYDLSDLNCTTFVYNACQKGAITLPDPYNTVGLGITDPETAMTPAGLGNSIEALKGKSNVNTNGGTTPNSKGPCN
ncbi:MAG: hypothetical protein M3O71_15445 [Bacteroidota bacterium]|nr:hypothetical protein [Bacteroidota bacterium]